MRRKDREKEVLEVELKHALIVNKKDISKGIVQLKIVISNFKIEIIVIEVEVEVVEEEVILVEDQGNVINVNK